MSCLISAGASKDCQYSFGGLDAILLANRADITSYTVSGSGMVTGIVTGSAGFYEFEFEKGTGAFTQELQISNGNKYFNQNVSFTLSGLDQSRMELMEQLGLANVVAICKDKRGKYFILGKQGGLEATALTANSGAGEGDGLGMTITLAGSSTEIGPEVTGSIVAAITQA